MRRVISKLDVTSWLSPLLIGVVVFMGFGLVIRRVGFYWDDWPLLLESKRVGPSGYIEMVGGQQRSLLALFYFVTTSILGGIHPLRWQVFALFVRWITSVAVWGVCKALWPDRNRDAVTVALLFAVYPGYLDHYMPIVYGHIFLVYALYVISLYLMVIAFEKRNWLLGSASLIATAMVYVSHDYYTGLEIARPLMIWYVLEQRKERVDVRKILAYWGPFLAVFVGTVSWKMFAVTDKMYEPALFRSLSEDFMGTMGVWSKAAAQDMIKAVVVAWENAISPLRLVSFNYVVEWQYSAVVLVVFVIVWGYLRWISSRKKQPVHRAVEDERKVTKQHIILGVVLLIGARLPYWIVPFYVQLHFPEDRFTIPMMLGASIFLLGLIELLTRRSSQTVILAALVGFGAGQQFWSGNNYVFEWQDQERFLRQFVWRIPSLAPGTAILTDKLPFPYSDDEAVTAMLNLLYTPEASAAELSYGFFDLSSALGNEIQELASGVPITKSYAKLRFAGSTSQAIVISYSPSQCLRVVNPLDYDHSKAYPDLLLRAMVLSDVSNIRSTPSVQPHAVDKWYGYDDHQGWCYYFEKADLARQNGDWAEVVGLGEKAFAHRVKYLAPEELYPFIEGYAMVGDVERARQLTEEVQSVSPTYLPHLCRIWTRVSDQASLSKDKKSALSDVLDNLECYRK